MRDRPEPTPDLPVHRLIDGDLGPDERAALEAAASLDPSVRARALGVIELGELVRAHAEQAAADVDGDALFSRVDAQLRDEVAPAAVATAAPATDVEAVVEAGASEAARPALRVLPGGAHGGRTRTENAGDDAAVRRRRVWSAVIGGLALAAALVLALARFTEPGDTVATRDSTPGAGLDEAAVEDRTGAPTPGVEVAVAEPGRAAAEEAAPAPSGIDHDTLPRTEVLEVDFGTHIGTIFAVEGDEGARYAVVWLDDSEDPGEITD